MSDDQEAVTSWLSRNKLTGVALSMLAELVILAAVGSWWVRGEAAILQKADDLIAKDMRALEKADADAEVRVDKIEARANNIEDRVLREIKEMRAEVNQRMDRIEDKVDRRDRRETRGQ